MPAGKESEVEVVGFNLPQGFKVKVPAAASGDVDVPLDARTYRLRKPLKVAVGAANEALEVEPNNAPAQATPLAVPLTVGGRIDNGGGEADNDYYRFESKAGQTWIVETDAARRGSPVDTTIEVLAADGKRIERLLLQAVRDSTVTFRGIDGNTRDCRLTNFREMQLNQLLYLNGEVVKLFRSPRGPDSGFLFYEGDGGKRLCYFDTTGTVHAVGRALLHRRAASAGREADFDRAAGLPAVLCQRRRRPAAAGERFAADVHRAGRRRLPGARARRPRLRRRPLRLSPDRPPAGGRLQREIERRQPDGRRRQRQAVYRLARSHRRFRGRGARRYRRAARGL